MYGKIYMEKITPRKKIGRLRKDQKPNLEIIVVKKKLNIKKFSNF